MMTRQPNTEYIPALKYGWLTSLYDPLLRWFIRESTFKQSLVEQARIETGQRVLDLGCGTATLTLLIKRSHPEADVVGIDADPGVLQIARVKAAKARLEVTLDRGMAFQLPYLDSSFDRVLSSLLFHHLTWDNKVRTFREVLRVLRPGDELHIADWGKASGAFARLVFLIVQLLDGFTTTADNVNGLLPIMLADAGFQEVRETKRYLTVFGTLSLYEARR